MRIRYPKRKRSKPASGGALRTPNLKQQTATATANDHAVFAHRRRYVHKVLPG
jgi:hypothetical protein